MCKVYLDSIARVCYKLVRLNCCCYPFQSEFNGGWVYLFQVNLSTSSSSSSLPSLDVSVSSGGGGGGASWQNSATPSKAGSLPRGTTPPHSVSPMRTPDFYVIRVSVSSPCKETEGINLYKSIMISNHEKTPQVIRNAMLKHSLEGNPDDFALAQLLPKSGNHLFDLLLDFQFPRRFVSF